MDTKLLLAIITITLALVFYTIGVFSERKSGELHLKHLILFGLGLVFDTTGTTIMSTIAKSENVGTSLSLHQVTGVLAIALMAFHLIWAIYVYVKGTTKAKHTFHKFSLVVWLFWLIPYIAGLIVGMSQ
ncbi:HsmA family protein [Enterococcus rivorum]|uniref:TIGR03987 family protein n=1 Tax=Enterococcus rivorum TaxID=762845 RepID=A0A1E5KSL4_9ENTE|nr:HsmA family protein [Enterococcus rivorum]MBP2098215.1 putative repeat protein (TIGR03987 family) [Enterococcus rivorum]OEH80864.1 TIGR03987 family protein [Enterococcus rivorum]